MSPKRWILLLIFYIAYLMFGASIYYHIEHGEEKIQRADELRQRIEINAYLLGQLANKNTSTQNEILERITDYCGKPVTDYSQDEYEIPYTWTFYHAFFFAFTVCSTVGYGNITPTTTLGRMIMIVYSVIGMPVNGILFAVLSNYFGLTFEAIYRRYKKYKMSTDIQYVPPQLGLITTVIIALIPGIAIFLLLPSWVFSYFESWDYATSFYYTYVTTTTIGFGDYVPTFGPDQPREFGGWFVVYQIFVIVWFIFSLAYLLMITTYITRGLQSKKLRQLEQQLSSNLKATQNRIWSGVTKDVGYLRRLLNELYILKVKPVYTEADVDHTLQRSNSCPDLSMYRIEPAPLPNRKRAFSMCFVKQATSATGIQSMVHASSDTEINKFDRMKSFETAEAYRQTTDLLAKVVTALANVKPPPADDDACMYGAYNGISDSEILASEWSFPTINDFTIGPPIRQRARASSDFNIEPRWRVHRPMMPQNEWTWSGDNNQIQKAINNRYKYREQDAAAVASIAGNTTVEISAYAAHSLDDEEAQKKSTTTKKFSMPDGLRRLFPFRKRMSEDVSGTSERKFSVISVPEAEQHAGATALPYLDYYSTITANASPTCFQNNGLQVTSVNGIGYHASNISLTSRRSLGGSGIGGIVNPGFVDDSLEQSILNTTLGPGGTAAFQRRMGGVRKRRESLYTQNPALSGRRGNIYPATGARRGSLATSGSAAMATAAARRGSLFPATANYTERRSSMFSVTSEKDMDVLEQTTLADLIRALEVVHTHAVLDEQQQLASNNSGNVTAGGNGVNRKHRRLGNAGLNVPQLPPILALFAGDQRRMLQATATNCLYARRSTVVGTMPPAITQRTPVSGLPIVEPPPSYSEMPPTSIEQLVVSSNTSTPISNAQIKFRRRFSVRPTALQIPPGQAPPPGSNILAFSPVNQTPTILTGTSISGSQTALQRRLSLRPSPLAREMPAVRSVTTSETSSTSSNLTGDASTPRLLPMSSNVSGTTTARSSTSSTHSPLSRIVQMSQAQRKSSMPTDAAHKSNNNK